MNALRLGALCAALLLSCKQEGSPAPAAAPKAVLAPSTARPPPPQIDDAVVAKFIAYDKKYLMALPQRMRAMRDELRKIEDQQRKKGAAAAPDQDGARAVLDRMTAEDRQMRQGAGLTDEQAHAMQELSLALASSKKNKGDLSAARRRFGDAAVDAVVRNEGKLVPLAEQHLAVFQEAMKLMMQR